MPSAPRARRAAPQMLGALRAPCASKFVSHGMPRDVARGGVDLRLMLVPHLVLQLSHGGLPWRFLRAFRREEDAHEPHQHAQPHETPRWKESAMKARCAYQSREWPRYEVWLASVAQAHTHRRIGRVWRVFAAFDSRAQPLGGESFRQTSRTPCRPSAAGASPVASSRHRMLQRAVGSSTGWPSSARAQWTAGSCPRLE